MAFANVTYASVILVATCNEDVEITMHTAITYFFRTYPRRIVRTSFLIMHLETETLNQF